ncbi:hypothetical protein BB559_000998 [Furculomyces boomerangus]|uniref:Sodium/potassium exporting P-type ATPase 1 n=2 Tax=Harpellales TaxID=61421 RepID=A0A2T9YE81_9FUNG|nr:hypothetical protein BB559_004501 [Furculomyces boomerangus]PVU99136.1 hypothetical protein BB559_000998 [Furculomyces boomerangus]PWA02947.1 hypothetical protein BB558_000897 [Smittium angustum]
MDSSNTVNIFHTISVEEAISNLETNITTGLTSQEVELRKVKYGLNQLVGEDGVSPWKVLLRQFLNVMVFILIGAGILSYAIKDFAEGTVVFVIVALNAAIGFYQEFKAEKTVDSLRKMTSPNCKVLRDGKQQTIQTLDLVPGDVISMESGDVVGADCRLFNTHNLETDEALLTGEALPIQKNGNIVCQAEDSVGDRLNLAYSSTIVTKGRSQGIVYAIGMNTEIGKIAEKLLSAEGNKKTQLNRSLDKMALILLGIALLLAIVVFAANKFKINGEVLLYAVSLAIAVIPEGLMAVVTLTMALGVRQMSKQQALVRQLNSIEILGSVTDICSDKTGTLTQSKMVLVRAWTPKEGIYHISGLGFEPVGEILCEAPSNESSGTVNHIKPKEERVTKSNISKSFDLLAKVSALCNMSEIKHDQDTGEWYGVGDPTEISMQVFATKLGYGKPSLTNSKNKHKVLCEFQFDSSVKRMTVIVETGTGEKLAFMKGATERVVDACTHILESGITTEISSTDLYNYVEPRIESMAEDGLRVISLAYRTVSDSELEGPVDSWKRESFENNLNYIGLVGIYDPPRPESRTSVEKCFQAGIMVRMLTGDHPITATAIAKQVGIIPDIKLDEKNLGASGISVAPSVMIAKDFDAMTPEQIDSLPELPAVIARCTPDTKVKLIEALHRRKAIAAMTGDGVNDSPSLKFADVGIAMGMTGSDVAKQASAIILTDDNFSTIVRAVAEGRRMFTNIRKFTIELIGSNVAELVCLTIGLAFRDVNGKTVFPLSPVAILTNNMLTGTPPAMALGTEKALPDNMHNPPRDVNEGLFNREVILDICVNGFVIGGLSITSYWLVLNVFGDGNLGQNCNLGYHPSCELVFRARGTNFANLTLLILMFAYSCRDTRRQTLSKEKIKTIFENRGLFASFISAWVITLLALYVPGLNKNVFKQSGITWEWGLVFASFAIFFVFDALYKYIKKLTFAPLYTPTEKQLELQEIATKMAQEYE